MANALELFLLDSGGGAHAVALGRYDSHFAIEHIAIDKKCKELGSYRDEIEGVILGTTKRPTDSVLRKYGVDLFKWLFRGSLLTLYSHVPNNGLVSVQILSDRPELKVMPWEFLQLPDRGPTPHRERCIVRVLPTCGIEHVLPAQKKTKLKILFVAADPLDLNDTQWELAGDAMSKGYTSLLPEVAIDVTFVEGATRAMLVKVLQDKGTYDILHFVGHGVVKNGVGHLVLVDSKTQKSDLIDAPRVASLLSGKGIRLAILSSCLSSSGNAQDDFSTVATSLLQSGISAVVANQVSIGVRSIASFVGGLYKNLLQTGDIDEAVTEGRIALLTDLAGSTGSDAVVEWGIPTLYRLSSAAKLFP